MTLFALLIIIILAAGFRLYDIQGYPGGLFPDEAANGEDALLVLDGDIRPFYPRGNGREGLYFFLEALSIKFFGIGVWQLHLVSALIGVATVAAMYFATRPWFGRVAGLLAAGLLATNHWHVTMSRTGFRAILIPLAVALFTAWVGYTISAVKKKKLRASYIYAALAGVALAGGFYTYIAYRVMIGVVLGILFFMFLAGLHPKIGFPHGKRYWRQVLVGVLAGLIVLLPLIIFFVGDPAAFVGRAGQVSIFNKDLQLEFGGGTLVGTLLYSLRETLYSFFGGTGDLNWRHNVAGFPLLNPLTGVLFLLGLSWAINGLVLVVYKIMAGKELHLGMIYPYLLLLISGFLVPIITTAEGVPHGLRSVGLIVPIFLLAGTAGAVSWRWTEKFLVPLKLRSVGVGVGIGLVVLALTYDGTLYFVFARNDSDAHYDYRTDLTDVSNYLNTYHREQPAAPRPYLVLEGFSLQSVHFLTSVSAHEYLPDDGVHPDVDEHIWRAIDPGRAHLTRLQPGELIIFTQSTMADADRYLRAQGDDIELLESRSNRFNQEIMRIYRGVPGEVLGTTSDLDA